MPERKPTAGFSFVNILPFIVLAATFAAKLIFYKRGGTEYWLDEIIVTDVSRQPLKLLFDTITAEPHPPGFYLFLKLLPVADMSATRMILVALSYALSAAVLAFGYIKGIVQRFRLQYGLSLFFATYSFLELSAHVRLEILAFPLMLLFLLLAVLIWDSESVRPPVWLAFAFSLTALMGIGYVYYFFCLAIGAALFLRRRQPALLFILLAQSALGGTYFLLFGRFQLLTNSGRFAWLGDHSNSLIEAFKTSLAGNGSGELIADLVVLLFAYLTVSLIPSLRGKNRLAVPVGVISLVLIVISYPLHLNVRTRYSSLLVLLSCVLAGWRIADFKRNQPVLLAATALILYSGLVSFRGANVGLFRGPFGRLLVGAARGQTYGYIEDSATLQFANKITYIPESNIIPVNIHFPSLSRPPFSINKTLLSAEGKTTPLNEESLRDNLAGLGIRNYFYVSEFLEKGNYIDENKLLMRVLDQYCRQRESRKLSNQFIFYTYRGCEFRQRFPYEL